MVNRDTTLLHWWAQVARATFWTGVVFWTAAILFAVVICL